MKPVAYLDSITDQEWLELRKEGIGASEVAGLMGYSPWSTPLSIYVEKVDGIVGREESLAMELGKELEPFMRRKFVVWLKRNEDVVVDQFKPKALYMSEDYPFIRCSPDDLFMHPEKGMTGVEYKTASEFMKDYFTDTEVPDQYFLQCQQCMYVCGLNEWYLAYLIGNRKFEVVTIKRDEETIDSIIETCGEFWNENILTQTPPAPTGSEVDTKALKAIYRGGADAIDLFESEEQYDLLKQYEGEQKELGEKIQQIKNDIMAEMKDHNEAVFGEKENGKLKRAVWKMTEPVEVKTYTRKGSRVFKTY